MACQFELTSHLSIYSCRLTHFAMCVTYSARRFVSSITVAFHPLSLFTSTSSSNLSSLIVSQGRSQTNINLVTRTAVWSNDKRCVRQQSCSASTPVSTEMGGRLWVFYLSA